MWECSYCKEKVEREVVRMEIFIPAQRHSQCSPWSLGTELPLSGGSQLNPETSYPLVTLQSLLKGKGEGSQSLNGSLSTAPGEHSGRCGQ